MVFERRSREAANHVRNMQMQRMRWLKAGRGRPWAMVALLSAGVQALGPAIVAPGRAHAHGGGGGHMGGFGGGSHMGGYGGGMGGYRGAPMGGMSSMPRGGFGGQDFGGGRIEGGRGLDGGRPLDGGRGLDAGRGLDGGRSLDGGARADMARAGGAGHFAGAGELSRADFQRIAAGSGRAGLGRDAVRPYSMNRLADRGDAIRRSVRARDWYGDRGWYGRNFPAWWPGGWWGGFGWGLGIGMFAGLAWGDLAGWGGYAAAPVAYDYGTTVQYRDDGVYAQGALVGTPAEYAAQASSLAAAGGADAKVAADDQWRSLGVFAVARAEESDPSTFLSLAIDRNGLLRGSYYDAVADATQHVTGKVDKKTQRAAWTIGDRSAPVYEAGLVNLTKDQTTVLVHRDGGKVEQMLLVRVPAPDGSAAQDGSGPAAGSAGGEGKGGGTPGAKIAP
jgi:hypothetical protein